MIMKQSSAVYHARALAILKGDKVFVSNWARLCAAAALWVLAGLDFKSFEAAAINVANQLCRDDFGSYADAHSKMARAFNKAEQESKAGGNDSELDLLDDLSAAHSYAEETITGTRTAAVDLLVYRVIILISESAHRSTGLHLGRYRIAALANISYNTDFHL